MTNDDDLLREERQAAALRTVADIGARRADLLRQAEELLPALRDAVVAAAQADAPRRRAQDLSGVGTALFYGWLADAGIPVRTKTTARKGGRRKDPHA